MERERAQSIALDAIPTLLSYVAADLRFAFANRAYQAVFGRSIEQIVGAHVKDVLGDRVFAESEPHLRRALAGGANEREAKVGDTWFLVRYLPDIDEAGVARGVVVQATDISQQRELQARILLADRMASVGRLAAGVAHEINNPLMSVTTNLEMIGEQFGNAPDPETVSMLTEARHGAERIRKIVRALQMFARTDDRGHVPLDVRGVMELAIGISANELRHRARLVRDFREAPRVLADQARLGQVFVNLLTNAAYAIPEGQAERHEIGVAISGDNGRVAIEVRDTGHGIAPEALGRIFDPFFTTRPIGKGVGLGLSICHSVVTDLGGEITVASTPGHGTTFRITLPAVSADLAATAPRAVSAKTGRRGRVLVIDDDEALGRAIVRVLDEHDVVVIRRAREALAILERGDAFDVILCDVMMPEMTGMELYFELARRVPDVLDRLVFMTGGTFTQAAGGFLDTVPNPFLEKPFPPDTIRSLIRDRMR